jgi:hypothetical protein
MRQVVEGLDFVVGHRCPSRWEDLSLQPSSGPVRPYFKIPSYVICTYFRIDRQTIWKSRAAGGLKLHA